MKNYRAAGSGESCFRKLVVDYERSEQHPRDCEVPVARQHMTLHQINLELRTSLPHPAGSPQSLIYDNISVRSPHGSGNTTSHERGFAILSLRFLLLSGLWQAQLEEKSFSPSFQLRERHSLYFSHRHRRWFSGRTTGAIHDRGRIGSDIESRVADR